LPVPAPALAVRAPRSEWEGDMFYDAKLAGHLTLGVLESIFGPDQPRFEEQACARGISLFQLAAAAIAGGIQEHCIRPGHRRKLSAKELRETWLGRTAEMK
jgi:hypothetical protein